MPRLTNGMHVEKLELNIREAVAADAASIANLNARLAAETEDRTLDPARVASGVAALLGDPTRGRYWVAEDGGRIVAQVGVTYEWSDWRNGMIWWIQSVYVEPSSRGQGVFSSLYRHVESLARNAAVGLRLYVDVKNHPARRTYTKLGMAEPGYLVMESDFSDASADIED